MIINADISIRMVAQELKIPADKIYLVSKNTFVRFF